MKSLLILALTIFPAAAFALAELDDVRERLINSPLDPAKQRAQKTDPPNTDLIGSKWWVVHRRDPHASLRITFGEIPWVKITNESFDTFYDLELPNGERAQITKMGFQKYVQQKILVDDDPAAEIEEEIRQERAEIRKQELKAKAAAKKAHESRVATIKSKQWPLPIEQTVIDRKVQIGMTTEQVTLAWGKPSKINRSVGRWGEHEQWVYGSTYLYFEGGLLKSFQDSR